MARIRLWMVLLAADDSAPAWNPVVKSSTPETLRRAARWIVDNGHAPEMDREMVCVLLALFIADIPLEMTDDIEEEFIPQDAAEVSSQ